MKKWFSQLIDQTPKGGRNAVRLALTFIVAASLATLVFAYVAVQNGSWQGYVEVAAFLGFFAIQALVIRFARRNQLNAAGISLIVAVCYIVFAMVSMMAGIGLGLSIALALVIVEIVFETLSGPLATRARLSGIAFAIGIVFMDKIALWSRPSFPAVQYTIPAIAAGTVITIAFLVIRRNIIWRDLSLARKLFILLLIPLAGLMYVSISGLIGQSIIVADTRRLETLINLSTKVGAAVHEVQKERGISALFLGSHGVQLRSELLAQRALSDAEIAELQSALQSIDISAYGQAFPADVKAALIQMQELSEKRKQIDKLKITADESNLFYGDTVDVLLKITFEPVGLNNNEISRFSSAYLILLQAKERAGRERANLTAALGAGRFNSSEFQRFLQYSTEQETYFNLLPLYASDEQQLFFKNTMKGQFVDDVARMKQTALETGLEANIGIDAQQWLSAATGRINLLKEVEDKLANDLLKSASEVRQSAQRTLAFYIAITIATLVLAVVSIFFSRAVSTSLQTMTYTARQIANGDLDQHIVANTQDEIGTLAGAFNNMTAQLKQTLENVNRRATELATVTEVSTAISKNLNVTNLLQEVVDLTKERFNLYHSHIYLLDEAGENLVLASGAGEPGRQMVAEGRSIPLNREQSLVARAARQGKGVTVNDVTQAPDFLPNPLLPDTRSELAVPMIVGGKVIGVFDVQSDIVGRFTDSDINIQTTLAAQVATSIQNVRSFEQSKTQADFELLVNTIGQKIQRATTVEDTLQTAVRELGMALGATRVKANIQTNRRAQQSLSQ